MRKAFLYSLLLLIALDAFGHAGEVHSYMGTVTALLEGGSFTMKTTEGKEIHVQVSKDTAYRHADGRVAKPSEVVAGKRVVVTMSKDGKTATTIKFAAAKNTPKKR